MWLLNRFVKPRENLKDVFLDEAAYRRCIDAIAVDSAARMARGGIALQYGDVVSEVEFEKEMRELKLQVEVERSL